MPYAKIVGTGSYLPKKVLTNDDFAKMVDTSDEWIMQRVGIRERHFVGDSGDTTCSMAEAASRAALTSANVIANQLDMIVVGTASGDYLFPSVGCILQKNLGITSHIPAFDVNAACAGFVYALSQADLYVRSGEVKTVLVVGVDTLSAVLNWKDRSTCVLFGDGAGAVVLQASDTPGIITTDLFADGSYANCLYATNKLFDESEMGGKLVMDGQEVFKAAVIRLGELVEHTLQKANMKQSDVDWLIPHQANIRIIQAVAKRLNLPMDRVVATIDHHGNTSAASIPLALDETVRAGKIKSGQVVLMEAFGGGLSWGSALVKM